MNGRVNHIIGSFISIWKSSHLAKADEPVGTDPQLMCEERAIQSYLMQMEILDPLLLLHSWSVAQYTELMAERLGFTENDKRKLQHSSLVHDLGMLAIQREILEKPGNLTSDEWKFIKAHPLHAVYILSLISSCREIIPIVKHHHEWYDGTGYPEGRKGNDIPLMSRIITLADSFVAMTSDRPYRNPWSTDMALFLIQRSSGVQFDPKLVAPFIEAISGREMPH